MNREFSVGDHVYLRVKAKKSSLKLGSCAKLSLRYCGPFEVLERIGPFLYRIAYPYNSRAMLPSCLGCIVAQFETLPRVPPESHPNLSHG